MAFSQAMAASLPLFPAFSSSSSSTGCSLEVKKQQNRASIAAFLRSSDSTESCKPRFSSSRGLTIAAPPLLPHSLSSPSTFFHIHPLRSHEVMPSLCLSVCLFVCLSVCLSLNPKFSMSFGCLTPNNFDLFHPF